MKSRIGMTDKPQLNSRPRRPDPLAALVRSGRLDAVFMAIDFVPQPMFAGAAAEHDSVELAKATLAALITLAKNVHEVAE